MKKITLFQLIIVLLFVACCRNLVAQTRVMKSLPPKMKQQNECYNKYYNAGTGYLNKKEYDPAIKQFEAAKYCPDLSTSQKKRLDSIIVDTYKKKRMVRVYRRV